MGGKYRSDSSLQKQFHLKVLWSPKPFLCEQQELMCQTPGEGGAQEVRLVEKPSALASHSALMTDSSCAVREGPEIHRGTLLYTTPTHTYCQSIQSLSSSTPPDSSFANECKTLSNSQTFSSWRLCLSTTSLPCLTPGPRAF